MKIVNNQQQKIIKSVVLKQQNSPPLRWKCFPALVSFINPQNPFTD